MKAPVLLFVMTLLLSSVNAHESPGLQSQFIRGDANADARVDIADAVRILGFVIGGAPEPTCLDAADADDDGQVAPVDGLVVLGHLFQGRSAFPAPYPQQGTDPSDDSLDCDGTGPSKLTRKTAAKSAPSKLADENPELQAAVSGAIEELDPHLDPGIELASRFRLHIKVVADDTSGTNAVLSPEEVRAAVDHANEIWAACCVEFTNYFWSPDYITYVPSGAKVAGGDGDLFEVEPDGGFVPSDEQQFLYDYDARPDKIEVVFIEHFVGPDGSNSLAAGTTNGGGGSDPGVIVDTDLTPIGIGYTLAHELGHAILGPQHSNLTDNLMQVSGTAFDTLLTAEQCEDAHASPLPRMTPPCQVK